MARAGRSVLQAFDIGDGTPKVLGRLLFDIENGKEADAVFKADHGSGSHALHIYELQKRAVLASEFMKIPEVGWSQCDADKWVWNQIKPLPKEMKVKCPVHGVIDNWRRSQRRQRKTPSLQSLWVEVEFDQEN